MKKYSLHRLILLLLIAWVFPLFIHASPDDAPKSRDEVLLRAKEAMITRLLEYFPIRQELKAAGLKVIGYDVEIPEEISEVRNLYILTTLVKENEHSEISSRRWAIEVISKPESKVNRYLLPPTVTIKEAIQIAKHLPPLAGPLPPSETKEELLEALHEQKEVVINTILEATQINQELKKARLKIVGFYVDLLKTTKSSTNHFVLTALVKENDHSPVSSRRWFIESRTSSPAGVDYYPLPPEPMKGDAFRVGSGISCIKVHSR